MSKKTLDIQRIVEMYGTMTTAEIARELNVSNATVDRRLREAGVTLRRRGYKPDGMHHNNLRLDADKLVRMYEDSSCSQIGAALDVCEWSVRQRLKKAGVSMRVPGERLVGHKGPRQPARKHHFNQDFFDVIDTEAKGYFLGFLMADGYVSRPGLTISVNQVASDADVLLKLKNAIGYTSDLGEVRSLPALSFGKYSPKPQLQLRLHSKHMVQSLARYGIVNRKSYNTIYPDLPDFAHKHFIRGLWDGDGGIYRGSMVLTGTEGLLRSVRTILLDLCGPPAIKGPFMVRQGDHWRLDGVRAHKHVLQLLYGDATVYMDRKYSVFLRYWS